MIPFTKRLENPKVFKRLKALAKTLGFYEKHEDLSVEIIFTGQYNSFTDENGDYIEVMNVKDKVHIKKNGELVDVRDEEASDE